VAAARSASKDERGLVADARRRAQVAALRSAGLEVREARTAAPEPEPQPEPPEEWYYCSPAKPEPRQLPLGVIVGLVEADRDGEHSVWKADFDGWKAAEEVTEIASALSTRPPASPFGAKADDEAPLSADDIQVLIAEAVAAALASNE